jgi:hypothetical protein
MMSHASCKVTVDERYEMTKEIEVSISCDDCVRRGTPDCEDCLVSFVLGETPGQLEMTGDDAHVVELFCSQGMIPRLRYQRSSS